MPAPGNVHSVHVRNNAELPMDNFLYCAESLIVHYSDIFVPKCWPLYSSVSIVVYYIHEKSHSCIAYIAYTIKGTILYTGTFHMNLDKMSREMQGSVPFSLRLKI